MKATEHHMYAIIKEDMTGEPVHETKGELIMDCLAQFKATGATFKSFKGRFKYLAMLITVSNIQNFSF